jgi:Na+/phosphate symporter
MDDLKVIEQRLHDNSVAVAGLAGEFKGFREDIKELTDKIDQHAKESSEKYLAFVSRVETLESDVNTAKKSIKAVLAKVGPLLIAAVLGALASRGIISPEIVENLTKNPVASPSNQE